jgi:hypothetical protein
VGTDFFQGPRPGDVGFFVEARLQLDENGNFLAGFGRLGQRLRETLLFRAAERRRLWLLLARGD